MQTEKAGWIKTTQEYPETTHKLETSETTSSAQQDTQTNIVRNQNPPS